ncbi:alpha/beta fold hydrolase [Nocardia sp. NPDC050712]|uniref:alpha/beta hydrolase family esterase n=1 Tax=Nocardia sp. NPDC050712 TaxID=3155518 RepID=UPI0033EBE09D
MASPFRTRLAALVVAVLALAIAAGPASAEAETVDDPAAACATAPTDGNRSATIDGREYLVNVPAGLPRRAPLVVALHGGFSNPGKHLGESGWAEFAAQEKFIVVAPQGRKDEGDADPATWAWYADAEDVAFIMKVVAAVRAEWCVDPKRIHLAGHSNGGQMASRVGCAESAFFASGAVYAPAPPPLGCDPARAISWGVFASAADATVVEPVAAGHAWYWLRENRECVGEANDGGTDVKDTKRWDCDSGTEVLWRVYHGGSHYWPTGARRTEMMNRMWQLFEANPLP